MGGLVVPQTVRSSNGSLITVAPVGASAAGKVAQYNHTTKRVEWASAGGGAPVAGISMWYSGPGAISTVGTAHKLYGGGPASLVDYSSEAGNPPGPVSGVVINEPGWEGYFKLSEAGVYSFRVLTTIALSKSSAYPVVARLALQRDAVYNDHDRLLHTVDGAATGLPAGTVGTGEVAIWEDWTIGPQWVQAGERLHPRVTMILPTAPAIGPNGASFTVEVTRYGG